MKFPIFIDGKETRFPTFNIYNYDVNNGNYILIMKLMDNSDIDYLIHKKNELSMNIKESFLIIETDLLSHAFDLKDNITTFLSHFSSGIGLVFGIENSEGIILSNFGPTFSYTL